MPDTATRTVDIPRTVTIVVESFVPMLADMGLVKPEAFIIETLRFDEMDVMEMVQDISEDLDVTVPFSEEEKLNTEDATVQTVIDLFTRLYAEQHNPQ